MILVDLTNLQWRIGRMKRNLAIFTNLLRIAEIDRGIYINLSQTARTRFADYFALPKVRSIATYQIEDAGVTVLQPVDALPLSFRLKGVAMLSGELFSRKILEIVAGDPFVLWLNTIYPIECGIASALAREAELVVFDNSDDMLTLEPSARRSEAERRLEWMLRLATKTTCVNEHVFSQVHHHSKLLFRNCTTFESLQKVTAAFTLSPWFPKPEGQTYVGFVGSLAEERVDAELLEHLFSVFPEVAFLFVGWISEGLIPLLARYDNAHTVPEVPNDVLGTVIRKFDVGIIPHRVNAATAGNDLLKLLDYNACGVPVVTTPVSGAASGYMALVASTKEEFASSVQLCLDGKHRLDLARGVEYARDRSWEVQVPKLVDWLGLRRR
jgi:glycosyltransferase involved in cell wall biosynthesis